MVWALASIRFRASECECECEREIENTPTHLPRQVQHGTIEKRPSTIRAQLHRSIKSSPPHLEVTHQRVSNPSPKGHLLDKLLRQFKFVI